MQTHKPSHLSTSWLPHVHGAPDTCGCLTVFFVVLSSGDSCGGPDPDRDVLRRAELVHGQHPAADLKPRCEGSDGGTVQRVAEAPAEPKHPRTLEPHRPLNQGPWTRHRHCLLHPPPNSRKPWLEGRCSCTETEHLRQTGGGLQVYSLFCCHADTFLGGFYVQISIKAVAVFSHQVFLFLDQVIGLAGLRGSDSTSVFTCSGKTWSINLNALNEWASVLMPDWTCRCLLLGCE